ncbi:phytanoyl-CoA dioxygenase [Hyaloraphidium curvatum]|nr:phytanoyl-CoA dioxygenase [Hyaloraphidium curvatum]
MAANADAPEFARTRDRIRSSLDASSERTALNPLHPVIRDAFGSQSPLRPSDPETAAAVEALERDGFVVLKNVISPEEADGVAAAIRELHRPLGRNKFEGLKSRRTQALVGKTSAMDRLLIHPRVIKIMDCMLHPNYLLSLCQAIELQPGEDAQAYHTDDGWFMVPRPRRHTGVNAFWALDAFTLENGATHLIPGSHKWGPDRFPDPARDEVVRLVMPKGSVALFVSTVWHAGGANNSANPRLGTIAYYGEPYVRTIENNFGSLSPAQAARLPPRLQGLLGYSIHPPNIGNVDGMNPLRSVDPRVPGGYRWLVRKDMEEGKAAAKL